ncbi:MAG: hypothetical protein LBL23_08040, partial [Coriobacteriales bacterium]|nr:hypothetical protein [Coriobacteriales bacterium]
TTNLAQSITRLVEKDEMSGRPGAKKSLILLSGSLPSAGDVYYDENLTTIPALSAVLKTPPGPRPQNGALTG